MFVRVLKQGDLHLVGTNRMLGLVTASQIASASVVSFFCRLT
jgi:hypothetical protein